MIPSWHIFHSGFDLFLSSRSRAVIDRANWNNCRISLCHHFCQQKMRQKKGKTSFYQTKLGFKEAFSLKEIRQGRKNTPHFFFIVGQLLIWLKIRYQSRLHDRDESWKGRFLFLHEFCILKFFQIYCNISLVGFQTSGIFFNCGHFQFLLCTLPEDLLRVFVKSLWNKINWELFN